MSRRFKNTVGKKRSINKEKRNRWISIESELQDVEQNRTIYFLLGGGDLKLNYVCILDDSSYRILIAKGTIVHEANSKINRLMILFLILRVEKYEVIKDIMSKSFMKSIPKSF